MGVIKKKPYEISVWEDRLVTENDISYYKEVKLAVIGSDKMESPNRVFDPVLIENVNGEKTLTFSLVYKYYDDFEGKIVTNPFYGYLINERKIKLFYNDEWNEFVIKECEESSEENTFNYTAKELFSLELAKLGYNVTLDTELNNNQGTIIELAKKVLENTDWEVDEANSDLITQYVQEPLYEIVTNTSFSALNLDTKELVDISADETIYVFYSYINNRETNFVQFIRENDRDNFFIDDDNVIKSTNYRLIEPVTYTLDAEGAEVIGIEGIGDIQSLFVSNQGYRLVYKIRTTYDPIMDRTVDIYQMSSEDDVREIYHFLDYNYTTTDIVVSYITNGSNFELYENGKLQGWYNTTPTSSEEDIPVLQPIRTTTYPELASTAKLQLINDLSKLNGYIELKFNDVLTSNYENTYFNEGFEHNATIVDHFSAGEKFALRTRYYTSEAKHDILTEGVPTETNGGLRVIVAKYESIEQECYLNDEAKTQGHSSKIRSYKILPSDIILDFDGLYKYNPNVISNGVFNPEPEKKTQYIVDDVVQTPSTAYIYKVAGDDTEYIWDCDKNQYVDKQSREERGEDGERKLIFADYYITTATVKQSLSNEELSDPKLHLGIFLYTKDNNLKNQYVYLQDIQLTRYYEDANENPVTIGSAPTAISQEAHKYYLKPTTQISEKEINTYGTLEALADELGANVNTITPVYNEEAEKVLSIQASQSNYFNILQDLCETFECWLDIRVSHEEDGSITLDKDFNPIKKVAFKEYAGKDNFAGFRRGINLENITRNIDSNEIVTKLIVDPVQSEYSDTGSIEIQRAKSNPSGQSYILNFSYYLNRGLITESREDFNKNLNTYYAEFSRLNKEIIDRQDRLVQVSNSLTKIEAERNTYTALIDEAEKSYNKAIAKFQKMTTWEYEAFANHQNADDWAQEDKDKAKNYLENETILDVVAQIYVARVTINNYTGILTNLDKTYQDLDLELNGAKQYNISVTFIPGNGSDISPSTRVVVDDYISGLQFDLWGRYESDKFAVSYTTTPNDRIFQAYNANPYQYIDFTNLPNHYQLRYYKDNEVYTLGKDQIKSGSFNIYDTTTGETYNRHFNLVPDEDYAAEHGGIQEEIDELIEQKNQLEKDFYKKYSRFLQEGTWSSQDYIDPELYYFDALQVSDTSAQPKVSYTINVLEVSQLDDLEVYNFRVGDKTYIEDPDFFGYLEQAIVVRELDDPEEETELPQVVVARTPVREEVIVSEIEWHFDEPDSNTITVQNYKTRFEDLFQRISATVQTVQRNEITYPKTSSILDQSGLINSTLLANSLDGIGGIGFALTTNGSVQAMQDGLLIRDILNPSNVMRLASAGLQVSTDGGNNWGTAISAEGISTDILTAGTINTQNIWLMDGDNPSFRWDKSGLNAYGLDEDGNESYDLKTYVRFDKYGLYGIKNDENYIATDIDDAIKKAYFSITWKGFSIKNSYTNGRVEITSDDDFRVLTTDENGDDHTRIKIGAIEHDYTGAPTKYGINIMNDNGEVVFDTGDDGNVTMTGTINAQAGMFSGAVSVGKPNGTHIVIDGESNNPTISSSNYSDSAGTGWIIDSNGDATFSNVSVRGAIKTAVFEYEEIQAVGGAFLFRPSSTIKSARYDATEVTEEDDEGNPITFETYYHYDEITGEKIYNDLIVTVEKPLMFRLHNWVKLSNYNELGADPAADLPTYGLVHIYEISEVDFTPHPGEIIYLYWEIEEPTGDPSTQGYYEWVSDDIYVISQDTEVYEGKTYYSREEIILDPTEPSYEITLAGGCAILDSIVIENIEGGALIDFGSHKQEGGIDVPGDHNYGIGINSSDNYVNLPARAISLFETTIHPAMKTKVSYSFRGILGTLPTLSVDEVDDSIYNQQMVGTQGIYTDNMYLGNAEQYLTFYTDRDTGDKKLLIKAGKIEYEVAPGKYADVSDPTETTKHIWYDSNGAHAAGGIENIDFNSEDVSTYGYNSLMGADTLALRYNDAEYVFINENGLNINHITYDGDNKPIKTLVATYGEETIIGNKDSGFYIKIDNTQLGFFKAGNDDAISYISGNQLYIPYSVVLNEMVVGRDKETHKDLWSWKVMDNNHLRLVWKGDV